MKQVLLYIGLGVGAPLTFLGLMYGMYLLYPRLKGYASPEAYLVALDSLRRAAAPDSLHQIFRESGPNPDSTRAVEDSLRTLSSGEMIPEAVWDSLAQLRIRLAALEAEFRRMQEAASPAPRSAAAPRMSPSRLQELASSLARLKPEELSRILEQLDYSVLQQLFWEVEENRRPLLLRAMPPEKAAALIQQMVRSR
jgi:hypothetical protein|nr:MAG: hypothetical protein KatS3mg041_0548 [Bacteroidota bacterium]